MPAEWRHEPAIWLPFVWAGLIAFAVLAYVLLDGFDLGVGILFAVERGTKTATSW